MLRSRMSLLVNEWNAVEDRLLGAMRKKRFREGKPITYLDLLRRHPEVETLSNDPLHIVRVIAVGPHKVSISASDFECVDIRKVDKDIRDDLIRGRLSKMFDKRSALLKKISQAQDVVDAEKKNRRLYAEARRIIGAAPGSGPLDGEGNVARDRSAEVLVEVRKILRGEDYNVQKLTEEDVARDDYKLRVPPPSYKFSFGDEVLATLVELGQLEMRKQQRVSPEAVVASSGTE